MGLVVTADFRRADLHRRILSHRIVNQAIVEIHGSIVGSKGLIHLQAVDIAGAVEECTVLLIELLVVDSVLEIIPI